MKNYFNSSLLVLACALPMAAQTFEINNQPSKSSPQAPKPGKAAKSAGKPAAGGSAASSQGFGWGSSIEVGRNARAAEDALKKGNNAAAATFAKRAVDAAPQNARLWSLYGYTARLAGRYGESVGAYKKSMQLEGSNLDAMSGLAQTYARMGNTEAAKSLLTQVLNKDPRRENDLLVAGELYMRDGDMQQGLGYLQRAESIKPSSHAELMMAIAYMKMKEPQRAKQLLDKAKARDPKNTDIFRAVATFYRETKQYEEAIKTLRAAPKMKPEVLADLAFTYEVAGHKKEAAQTYARVANEQPKQIGYQLSAANAFLRLNDMKQVENFLARARSIDPDQYRLHAIQAAVAKIQNKPQEAIREYSLALAKMPEALPEGALYPIQLRLNLSELYKGAGDDAAARQQMALAEQEINKIQVGGEAKAEFLRVRASIRASSNDLAGAERDLLEARKLDPANINVDLQYANLLWRMKRTNDAKNVYASILKKENNNRYALEGLGYISREQNDTRLAEQYFTQLAKAYPDDYVAYLALGDMYTSLYQFDKAEVNYESAFKIAPANALIVANGANAAIESHKIELAKTWLDRAQGPMLEEPRVMRERERYLFHTGKYAESAQLGYKVLEKLPKDRNASVYLAYDLYNLGRYDDVLSLATRFEPVLPKEPNFPLLTGHVHKQSQLLSEAVDDYTRAIDRDPNMVEAYVNRGYVLNDLQNAERAVQDFDKALSISPNNGVAELGIAFSDLQLRHARQSLEHVAKAEALMGESGPTHLVRATAYRQLRDLDRSQKEYRIALKYSPDDLGLHLALADTLYHSRRYTEAITALSDAMRLSPDDPFIYAQLAQANAQLKNKNETFKYVEIAEKQGSDYSGVLLATGEALMALGDTDAAMERFARALDAPDSNRVDARLSIARLFARDGKFDDAKQQVSLAFAESRIGEASPVSADDFIEAANIFLAAHDFDLAKTYYQRARAAGAGDEAVAIGMANTYIAMGDDRAAETQLAKLGSIQENSQNYDYLLAQANIYRQRHQSALALGAFARANQIASNDDTAERLELETAGDVGVPMGHGFTTSSFINLGAIFENSTVYELDAKIFGVASDKSKLPPPRSSVESLIGSKFRYLPKNFPTLVLGYTMRSAIGQVSIPSESLILNRHTNDTIVNFGTTSTLRLGGARINFEPGVQYTIRRDTQEPVELNQHLTREYLYMSTTPFFNWLSMRGNAFHESGPFTARKLSSKDTGAGVEFTVGRPWGRTSLVTGWAARDLQFSPLIREFFTTNTYAGIERKFGKSFKVAVLGEFIRSWRVQDSKYATAQSMVPGARFEYRPNNVWQVEGHFAMERGQGFHAYDNVQSGFFISYVKPIPNGISDGFGGVVNAQFPVRFSIGIQQETFMNFTGRGSSQFKPVMRLSFF